MARHVQDKGQGTGNRSSSLEMIVVDDDESTLIDFQIALDYSSLPSTFSLDLSFFLCFCAKWVMRTGRWYEGVDDDACILGQRGKNSGERRNTQKRRQTHHGVSTAIEGKRRRRRREEAERDGASWIRSRRRDVCRAAPAGSSGKVGDVSGVKAAERCSAVAAGASRPLSTPLLLFFLAYTHTHTRARVRSHRTVAVSSRNKPPSRRPSLSLSLVPLAPLSR